MKHFRPNPWGQYQMHGNVWEWCEDRWHDNYEGAPDDGQPWMTEGDSQPHVCRGGSWFSSGRRLPSASRYYDRIDILGGDGLRLARGPELQRRKEKVHTFYCRIIANYGSFRVPRSARERRA